MIISHPSSNHYTGFLFHSELFTRSLSLPISAFMAMPHFILRNFLPPQSLNRTLRSASSYLLKTPRTKLRTMGDRAFCSSAPNLWNALPVHLRTPQPVNALNMASKRTFLAKPLNKFIVGVVVLFN